MNTKSLLGSSLLGWIVLACVACFYLFTFKNFMPVLRQDRVKFGIDLVGGTYITLEVDTNKALEADLLSRAEGLKKILEKNNKSLPIKQTVENNSVSLEFQTPYDAQLAAAHFKAQEAHIIYTLEGCLLTLRCKEQYAKMLSYEAVKGNVEVLRTRLDGLGIGEIPIAAQGDRFIVVELPSVNDPLKAKEMIGRTALLELKLVEYDATSPEEIIDHYDGDLPDDMIILPGRTDDMYEGQRYYLVAAYTDLTGRLLKDARGGFGGMNGSQPVVQIMFNHEGAEKFYELTKNAYRKKVAIILDGMVITAPGVNEPIKGGSAQIQGSYTPKTAQELANLLKSGAFIAPVKFAQERQIGPSLGKESINKGILACLVGLGLLFIFSISVYKTAGLFAFIALLYNLLLILMTLGWLRATLTLPGIAGMVLTVGMAIDASILIYEKIREELAKGTQLKKAVDDGFSDALEVILDSNITTMIVGLVLYKFGTGPIQGFALSMMIGIVATLITGLFFLRSIFNFLLYTVSIHTIRI